MYMVGTHVWNNGQNGFGMITDVGHLQIVNTFAMGNGIDIMYIKSTGQTWAMPKNGWSGNLVYNATFAVTRNAIPRQSAVHTVDG